MQSTFCLKADIYLKALFTKLGLLDRLLFPLIFLCMVIGVLIGVFVKDVQQAFNTIEFHGVSVRECLHPILSKIAIQYLYNSDCSWSHLHDVAYPY